MHFNQYWASLAAVAGLAVHLLSDAAVMMTGALIDFDQSVIGAYG